MSCATSPGAPVFLTTYLLFATGCVAQKVYFDCGAKVDVVDVQGLILSPGFPYNYSSGTHCVWQFFVPVDYQLVLEVFDFDVFESHNSAAQYASTFNSEEEEEEEEEGQVNEEVAFPPGSPTTDKRSSSANLLLQSGGEAAKTGRSSQRGEDKRTTAQDRSETEAAKVSNSAKRSADAPAGRAWPPPASPLVLPGAAPAEDKAINSASSPHLPEPSPSPYPGPLEETTLALPQPTDTPAASPETQHSVLDACPHDVLYISDLITFSSRFCGSNRPPSSELVFGSSQEMVEVIMELITTTHWGRGFALLFHYHNLTEPGGSRHLSSPAAGKVDSLLAAVSGAAFFAMVLTSALCVIFRPKLCPKRGSSCSSTNSEVPEGVQNTGAEVSELQLMAENRINTEATADAAGDGPPETGAADNSENAEVDLCCSGLTELDLGADEVFIVSSAPCPSRLPVSPRTQRDRFLRHSDTGPGPGPAGDWPSPEPATPPGGSKDGGCARPRAWSVRTFQDLLPPLPQLHRKWCSWNATSPFTKLVDSAASALVADGRGADGRKVLSDAHLEAKAQRSAVSDSSISNASYPLTQSAQRQRRLNSISNLRRSRFAGPCFGLLPAPDPARTPGAPQPEASPSEPGPSSSSSSSSSSPSAQRRAEAGKRREGDHVSVPVFAISEEEDRQPLVPCEHLGQASASAAPNGSVKGAAGGSDSLEPLNQRARPEWRPWGSQASGGLGLLSPAVAAGGGVEPPLRRATVLCSVTNQM